VLGADSKAAFGPTPSAANEKDNRSGCRMTADGQRFRELLGTPPVRPRE
jgi:hypothetical protein